MPRVASAGSLPALVKPLVVGIAQYGASKGLLDAIAAYFADEEHDLLVIQGGVTDSDSSMPHPHPDWKAK